MRYLTAHWLRGPRRKPPVLQTSFFLGGLSSKTDVFWRGGARTQCWGYLKRLPVSPAGRPAERPLCVLGPFFRGCFFSALEGRSRERERRASPNEIFLLLFCLFSRWPQGTHSNDLFFHLETTCKKYHSCRRNSRVHKTLLKKGGAKMNLILVSSKAKTDWDQLPLAFQQSDKLNFL